MSDVTYQHYIGQGPEAEKLIRTVSEEIQTERLKAVAVAEKYGAVTCMQRGSFVVGLVYAEPQNQNWLKESVKIQHDGKLLPGYEPRLNTKKGKELAKHLKALTMPDYSKRIVAATGMGRTILALVGGRACLCSSSAGFRGETIVVKVPVEPMPQDGIDDDPMPTPPPWIRQCKESEMLAAMGK